jgi:hypothetical protein
LDAWFGVSRRVNSGVMRLFVSADVNMQIANLHPSKRVAAVLHSAFSFIYLLLIVRIGILFYESPIDLNNLPHNSLGTLLVKRMCGILYAPFFAVFIPPEPDGEGWFIATIIFAILGYALIHYGMLIKVDERSNSMLDKVLKFCRAIFFLAGALFLLLIVARMSVMLYQDVAYGRMQFGVGAPAKK